MANVDKGKGGRKRTGAKVMTKAKTVACESSSSTETPTAGKPEQSDADVEEMRRLIFDPEHRDETSGGKNNPGIIASDFLFVSSASF